MTGDQWRAWAARLGVVVAAVVVAVSLTKLWSYANTDNPDRIEQSDIVELAGVACARMRDSAAAAAVSPTAPLAQRVGAINAQDDAVIRLITTMKLLGEERLGADLPSARWLEDWQRLVTARDTYAKSLATGKPAPLTFPTVGGKPLVDRLNGVGVNCRVPLVLLASRAT